MGLLDMLEGQAETLAGRFGIPPDKVRAIVATLEGKLSGGAAPQDAAVQTADQHNVPTNHVQDILSQLAGGGGLSGLGGLAKGLLG